MFTGPGHLVPTQDLAPTLLGALGVEAPPTMGGRDLSALFGGGDRDGGRDLAGDESDTVGRMFEDYALGDAGGPSPTA